MFFCVCNHNLSTACVIMLKYLQKLFHLVESTLFVIRDWLDQIRY